MKHMTRTDRILHEEIGDYPDLDLSGVDLSKDMFYEVLHKIRKNQEAKEIADNDKWIAEARLGEMRFNTYAWLNSLVLPPRGTINNPCKSVRHGVAYRAVNKTNKGKKWHI